MLLSKINNKNLYGMIRADRGCTREDDKYRVSRGTYEEHEDGHSFRHLSTRNALVYIEKEQGNLFLSLTWYFGQIFHNHRTSLSRRTWLRNIFVPARRRLLLPPIASPRSARSFTRPPSPPLPPAYWRFLLS